MSATHLPPQHRGIFAVRRLIQPDGSITPIKAGLRFSTQLSHRGDLVDSRLQGFYFPEARPDTDYAATNFVTSQVTSFRNLSASEEAIADNFQQLVKDGKISYTYEQEGTLHTIIYHHCYRSKTVALTRNGSAFILVALK